MARTLQQLKESVERLIEQQGADSPVAAFIFTIEDVFEIDQNTLEKHCLPDEDVETVLDEIESFDHIYETVFNCIEDEVRSLNHHRTVSKLSQAN